MAKVASLLPAATGPGQVIVDLGGTVFWVPIYTEILGYKRAIILARGSWADLFADLHRELDFEAHACDVELERYPLEDGMAGCVVCFAVLEHLAGDPMGLVAESNRILGAGGVLCLTTPNVLGFENLGSLAFGGHPFGWSVFTDSYADRHNREYTPFEVRDLLICGGFSVSSLTTMALTPEPPSRARLAGMVLALPAALTGKVGFAMRRPSIVVQARKEGPVVDRYPAFLYELYGEQRVSFKLRTPRPQ